MVLTSNSDECQLILNRIPLGHQINTTLDLYCFTKMFTWLSSGTHLISTHMYTTWEPHGHHMTVIHDYLHGCVYVY